MRVKDFDYELPEALIAQHPIAERSASRLMHLDGATGHFKDLSFTQLPDLLGAHDVLVVNDTRVIKARLHGRKSTGGKIELFVDRILDDREALALIRSSQAPRPGSELIMGAETRVEVLAREGDLFRVRFQEMRVLDALERWGSVPLPPYIQHAPDTLDEERYQTVFAAHPGAVAAPTAGLHFDGVLLDILAARGISIAKVTLHVGAGTFQPVRTETVEEHRMHREHYGVSVSATATIQAARARGGRVVAVGTTSLRALETAAFAGPLEAKSGETELFIHPGFRFRIVDRLITNFHLPRSSLLMLAAAFGGYQNVRRAYEHAIAQRYRFFSYGDAMLIEKAP